MKRRPYTETDLSIIRESYLERGGPWCARRLGRTEASVRDKAIALGIARKRNLVPDSAIADGIKRLHPLGLTDVDIHKLLVEEFGRALFLGRIGKIRDQLGLPSNVTSDYHRKKLRHAARNALTKHNVQNLTELRWSRWRQWKTDRGLPEDLTNLAAMALEHFFNLGPGVPITRVALCHLLGVDPRRKNSPASNRRGGSVLSELIDRGFIGRLKRAHDVTGQTGRFHGRRVKVDLYYLLSGVKRNDTCSNAAAGVAVDGVGGRSDDLADETASDLHQLDHAG